MTSGSLSLLLTLLLSISFLFTTGEATPLATSPQTSEDALTAVLTNMNTVADNYVLLHESVRTFDGNPEVLSTLRDQESAVEIYLKKSISAAEVCPPLNNTASKQIMAALGQPYPNFMSDLLGNITEKEPTFEKASAKPMVLGWLKRLYRLSNDLPLALEQITVKADSDEIESGRQWSNDLFARALATYDE